MHFTNIFAGLCLLSTPILASPNNLHLASTSSSTTPTISTATSSAATEPQSPLARRNVDYDEIFGNSWDKPFGGKYCCDCLFPPIFKKPLDYKKEKIFRW